MHLFKKILLSTYFLRDIVIAMNTEMKKIKPKPCYSHLCFLEIFLGAPILSLCCPICAGSGIFIIMHFIISWQLWRDWLSLYLCLDTWSNAHYLTSLWLLYFHCTDYISIYRKWEIIIQTNCFHHYGSNVFVNFRGALLP